MMAQIAALAIFVAMFVLIVMDKIERHIVTLVCGAATLVVVFGFMMGSVDAVWETLNVASIGTLSFWYEQGVSGGSSSGINWETIIFIAGMMVMVEGMAKSGFFRWLCMELAKLVRYKTTRIFVVFMVMSAVLSMFIDSITVILFLAAVTVELSRMLRFSPVPMVLAEIFCANLGGSATMCGDPPNIIVGTSLGYTFADFITNTGVIAGISLIVMIIYFYLCFRKELARGTGTPVDPSEFPEPKSVITDKRRFAASCIIFLLAVALLVTHAATGLTVALIGVLIALITLAAAGRQAIELLRGIDYKTLLFFVGLFIVVGGLEQTGILDIIAQFIADISGGSMLLMVTIILWISGVASAFIDNIPFAATMIPVIKSLAATQGVDLSVLAWSLAMGTDIGGSATPIGASANVVGTSVVSKAGYPISWGKYCKYMAPATILVLLVSMAYIWVRYL